LLNVDQRFGHRRFPRKYTRLNNFLIRAIWLLLALKVWFWQRAGTFSGTIFDGEFARW
jgi:hypothetical protein